MTCRLGLALAFATGFLASCCLQTGDGSGDESGIGSGIGSGNGSGGEQCFATPPTNHRPAAVACTSAPYCQQDADCALPGSKRICSCAPNGIGAGDFNRCIGGDCLVDSDCSCGYCSPSEGTRCIYTTGYVGYFCHTKSDTCLNDSECDAGLCEFNPMLNHWACLTAFSPCTG